MIYTIAVDGPVGAGKSSVADEVAKRLGILHLDTGAMYRAFAWYALKQGISMEDEAALVALTEKMLPEVRYENGSQRTLIDGQDVTGLIRTPEISMATSTSSKFAGVRRAMVRRQQELAKKQSMLLDGRDIGTVVLKDATIKIYLTASAEVRAKRRFDELQKKGDPSTYEEVLADVIRRDEQDMNREVDPLRPAEDAQMLDSSEMTQEQVVEDILRRVRLKLGQKPKCEVELSGMYRFVRGVFCVLFKTVLPVTFHHLERVQLDAPYILVGNHSHMFDPMLIGYPVYRYAIRFMSKKELMENAFLRWVLKGVEAIPVDRHNMDMGAIRASLKTLKEGKVLGIFPEGTRHKEGVMQDMESGAAMIALRSGCRMLPAYISRKPRLFTRTHVYFGDPISVKDIAAKGINKDSCDELSERIAQAYRALVEEHQKNTADA
ncbi:MAG: (d)CMP kinase [Clostridia bacterium]|nr:(d)CMP kinase [Clostridia bacterium]